MIFLKRYIKILTFLIVLVVFSSTAMAAEPFSTPSFYYFNYKGNIVAQPSSFITERKINLEQLSGKGMAEGFSQMCVDKNLNIYLLNSQTTQLLILDKEFNLITSIDKYLYNNNEEKLLKPQGIFANNINEIYISDTENSRIVVLDKTGLINRIIKAPKEIENEIKQTGFHPTKLCVDKGGRIYTLVNNVNFGIVELDSSGSFNSFFGAPSVSVDPFILFWRRFSTKEQRAKMKKLVPTEYNNLAINDKGFIYATISAIPAKDLTAVISIMDKSGRTTPIRKLSPSGDDVLKRLGAFAPIGSLDKETISTIGDVAISKNEIYSLLDTKYQTVYTYDEEGNLLFVFGSKGEREEQFIDACAIEYINDKLIVLDKGAAQLIVKSLSNYGGLLFSAVKEQANGNYIKSEELWGDIIRINSSFELAYMGTGHAQMRIGKYDLAMESYLKANDKVYYSQASELKRKALSQKSFALIFFIIISSAFLLFLLTSIKKILIYIRKD